LSSMLVIPCPSPHTWLMFFSLSIEKWQTFSQ
jgi:hypothetical protein